MTNKVDIENMYPLSPLQQGLLSHALQCPESRAYFGQQAYQFEGVLDPERLKQAWQQTIDRHTILRTAFVWEGVEQMTQVVLGRAVVPWIYADWSHLAPTEQQAKLDELLLDDQSRGIDVSRAPLLRLNLVRCAPFTHYLVVSQHHLILDGWSYGLILKEVMALYQSLQRGIPLKLAFPPQYLNFIEWLNDQETWRAEEFWRGYMADFSYTSPLPFARRTPSSGVYADLRWLLTPSESQRLSEFARKHHYTLSVVIQCVWALVLNQSGKNDVTFGVAASIRPPSLARAELIVGAMMNTVPLRAKFAGETHIDELLDQLQRNQPEVQAHAFAPLVRIQQWTPLSPGEPLFRSVVVIENYPTEIFDDAYGVNWGDDGDLKIYPLNGLARTHYPLTVHVLGSSQYRFEFVYDRGVFSDEAMELLLERLKSTLNTVITEPNKPVCQLLAASEQDKAQVLKWGAGEKTEISLPSSLLRNILSHSRERAECSAIECSSRKLTYEQFEAYVNKLAWHLARSGVGLEVPVAVYMERDWQAVVTILAVMKTGATFVPIDTATPIQRVRSMITISSAQVIITESSVVDRLPTTTAPIVCLDEDWETIIGQNCPEPFPTPVLDGDNLAYILFTSGSTGTPKAVGVTHLGLENYLSWAAERYAKGGLGAVLYSSLSFDLTLTSLFLPLLTGTTLIIASDPEDLSSLMAQLTASRGLSFTKLTPSHLRAISSLSPLRSVSSLDTQNLILGGEQVFFEDLVFDANSEVPRVFNEYGPTETVVGCIAHQLDLGNMRQGNVPIGRPISNTYAFVVSSEGDLLGIGTSGELFIGGSGLARGYIGDPCLTAERFTPDPFSGFAGARLYRTGDFVLWQPNGEMEYLGRADQQIKVRGHRVELGEIESVVSRCPGVSACAVVAHPDDQGPGISIVCYVSTPGRETGLSELRDWCQNELPNYMVPAAFITLDELPLTITGKVDRTGLARIEWRHASSSQAFAPPIGETEELIAEIWKKVLNRDQIGRDDNFFRIGGHSLVATQVVSRIDQIFHLSIPFRLLFEAPTIADLSKELEAFRRAGQETGNAPQPPRDAGGTLTNLDDLSEEEVDLFLERLQDSSL